MELKHLYILIDKSILKREKFGAGHSEEGAEGKGVARMEIELSTKWWVGKCSVLSWLNFSSMLSH